MRWSGAARVLLQTHKTRHLRITCTLPTTWALRPVAYLGSMLSYGVCAIAVWPLNNGTIATAFINRKMPGTGSFM
jgi:hypothetical protein